MQFRFLHCADVHLGKYAHQSSERYGDYFAALDSVVRYACGEKVDALLIAGDLFDEQEPSNETLRRAMETLRPLRTAGIHVVGIEGNHDRRKRSEPSGAIDLLHSEGYLRLLRPQFGQDGIALLEGDGGAMWKPVPGIVVAGMGFVAHNIEDYVAQAASQLPADDFVIFLAHLMVAADSDALEYGCIAQDDLAPLRDTVGYLALGHRHTRVGLGGETEGWIFNPGSLEYVNSLDYRLPAELRGFYDVVVSDVPLDAAEACLSVERLGRHVRVRHVPTEKRPALTLHVDVTTAARPSDAVELLRTEAEAAFDETLRERRPIVVVRLNGALAMSRALLPREAMAEMLRQEFGALHVEIMDRDLLGNSNHAALLLDDAGLELVADRARAIAAELLRDRGIAHGKEDELAAVLLDLKTQLHGASRTPGPSVFDDIRRQLLSFVEVPEADAALPAEDAEARIGGDT